jgi:cytochrome c-type protein NapB
MSAPNYEPIKKGTWVVGAILLTAAVSGYFMGLQQTGSTLNMSEPVSAITPDSIERAASRTNDVPVAVAYRAQNWLEEGPNARWENTLAGLEQPASDPSALTNITEADRELARRDRGSRRAFEGAPPVVPHAIAQDTSAVCMACHAEGLAVKDRFASRMSHEHYLNCTQCHVPAAGARMPVDATALVEPIAVNTFTGVTGPRKGLRAWPEAPPTIPHATSMRSDCMSCHGPTGLYGLRTSHPERQACTQCHVPSAVLDQHDFLTARPLRVGADAIREMLSKSDGGMAGNGRPSLLSAKGRNHKTEGN